MYDSLLQEFRSFITEIRGISFQDIKNKFEEKYKNDPISKFVGRYVPQLIQYQQEFDIPNFQHRDLKKTASFDRKQTFTNTDNLHRQIISIFKSFVLSKLQDFREYLRLTVDIDQLSKLLSRLKILSQTRGQFNLILYLFTACKRTIKLFVKLRDEILKESTLDKNSFLPISTHNPSKYVQKQHYLQQIVVSRKKKQWQHLMGVAGFQYHDQLAMDAFNSQDQVPANKFIQYCLWINKQTIHSSPKK